MGSAPLRPHRRLEVVSLSFLARFAQGAFPTARAIIIACDVCTPELKFLLDQESASDHKVSLHVHAASC